MLLALPVLGLVMVSGLAVPAARAAASAAMTAVAQLNTMTDSMDAVIQRATTTVPGVQFASTKTAFKGHELCSGKPFIGEPPHGSTTGWFHPDPAGQQALANVISG